jgi:DNA-binding MarR family transcriptional regulator
MDAVMNIIAFSRQNGVTQTDLAIELDMDARALFSITKKLVEQNLMCVLLHKSYFKTRNKILI